MTAIAASSLLGLLDPWSLSIMSMPMWGFSPVKRDEDWSVIKITKACLDQVISKFLFCFGPGD